VAVCAEAATEAESCPKQNEEATVVEEATEAQSCAKQIQQAPVVEEATEAQSCAKQNQEATVVEEATEAQSCAKKIQEATVVEEATEAQSCAKKIDEATEEHIEEEDEGEAVQGNACALRMYSVRRNDRIQTDPIQEDSRAPGPSPKILGCERGRQYVQSPLVGDRSFVDGIDRCYYRHA
jgi:hypothetical protein